MHGRDVASPCPLGRRGYCAGHNTRRCPITVALSPFSHRSLCSSQAARSTRPVLGFPIPTPLLVVLPYPPGLTSTLAFPSPAHTPLFQKGFPRRGSQRGRTAPSQTPYPSTLAAPLRGQEACPAFEDGLSPRVLGLIYLITIMERAPVPGAGEVQSGLPASASDTGWPCDPEPVPWPLRCSP